MNKGIFAQPHKRVLSHGYSSYGLEEFSEVVLVDTSAGTRTFWNHSDSAEEVLVVVMGGGGGGAASSSSVKSTFVASGGAGGATGIIIVTIPAKSSVNYVVGAGGSGASGSVINANGSTGGTSSFGSLISCGGGGGGAAASALSTSVSISAVSGGAVSHSGGMLVLSAAGVSQPAQSADSARKIALGGAPPGSFVSAGITIPAVLSSTSAATNGVSIIGQNDAGDDVFLGLVDDAEGVPAKYALSVFLASCMNIAKARGASRTTYVNAGDSRGPVSGGSVSISGLSDGTPGAVKAGDGGIGGGGGGFFGGAAANTPSGQAGSGGTFGGGGGIATQDTGWVNMRGGAGGVGAGGGGVATASGTVASGSGGNGMVLIARRPRA